MTSLQANWEKKNLTNVKRSHERETFSRTSRVQDQASVHDIAASLLGKEESHNCETFSRMFGLQDQASVHDVAASLLGKEQFHKRENANPLEVHAH